MSKKKLRVSQPTKPQISITAKVRARMIAAKAQKILPLAPLAQAKRELDQNMAALATPEELVEAGSDPVFALYASVQQMLSFCTELLIELPELRVFRNRLEKLDADYMPGFPPMSPITGSYFAMWTQCDLRVGDGPETMASIFAGIGNIFGLEADYLALITILANSRMGIYEHCGLNNGTISLRELVTDKEFPFVGTSGYVGNKGELWFVRAVPPPMAAIPYWVGMGTPHVLRAPGQAEWLEFFARNGIRSGEVGFEQRLNQFLKFGPQPRYWSELIFEGFSSYNSGAIFLHGLPDIPESRPHSRCYNPRWAGVHGK